MERSYTDNQTEQVCYLALGMEQVICMNQLQMTVGALMASLSNLLPVAILPKY